MLESQAFQQNQGQAPPISPETLMVDRGKMRPSNPDNTPENERVSMVYRFYNESKSSNVRQDAVQCWKEADSLLKGKQRMLDEGSDEYDYNFVINKIYSTHEKIVSLLMEDMSVSETEILPRQDNQHLLAEALDNFFKHEWERNNWGLTLGTVLKQAVAHRVGWLKIYWDVHGDKGRGTVRLEPISNYDLFLHEDAMIREGELVSKYIIHRMDKSRNQVIGQWRVDPTGEFQMEFGLDDMEMKPNAAPFLDGVRDESAATLGMVGLGADDSRSPGHHMKKDNYEVLECHYLDDSLVSSQGYDELPDPELQYPGGRILIVANGHLLHDGPNRNGFCMFVPITTDPDIESIYGPSIINHLSDPQMALNKGFSQIFAHADLCADPILAISQLSQSLLQDSDIRKSGSQIVIASSDDMPQWLTPPPLGGEVFSMVAFSSEAMEDVSGVHEVAQGETSTNARSGVAIDKLQASGATRSNLRSDFRDQGMMVVVRNVCSLFLDYVEDDRQYRFLDEDSMLEEFGTFNGTELVFPSREALITQYQQHQEKLVQELMTLQEYDPVRAFQMQPMYAQEIEELEQKIMQTALLPAHDIISLDVRIQTGTRSMTKSFLMNMVLVLFEYDIIPEETVLKLLDFPGWRTALRMKREKGQLMAEAEEMAIEKQFDLEKAMKEVEQANSLELEEMEGAFKIIVARIQARAAEKRAAQSAQ